MSELEGLRRCSRVGGAATAALGWVSGGAGSALRVATSRGSLLASRAFTAESDSAPGTNDDRVLATALNLHANLAVDAGQYHTRILTYTYSFIIFKTHFHLLTDSIMSTINWPVVVLFYYFLVR